jgi:hypothetical protein
MSAHSLGYITVSTPGTPVRVSFNQADPTKAISCNGVLLQALFATNGHKNTGLVYILDRPNPNYTSGVGVLAILGIPTSASMGAYSASMPAAAAALNVCDFWIDADIAGDGVVASFIR